MSYGTSAVIVKPVNDSDPVPFIFIGGFDGMNWHMAKHEKSPERVIQHLNNGCKDYLSKEPNGITTIEKLMTAPMDEVIVITGESTYESMKGRKAINGIGVDLKKYLEIS